MDERTSKIANIISTKEVDTSMWKMFRFVVKMENWDEGSMLKKSEDWVTVWMELTYVIKDQNWFKNIVERREKKKYSWWFSNNANAQLVVCAMQCATQLVNNWTVEFEFYKENFDVLYDWMKKKYEGQ